VGDSLPLIPFVVWPIVILEVLHFLAFEDNVVRQFRIPTILEVVLIVIIVIIEDGRAVAIGTARARRVANVAAIVAVAILVQFVTATTVRHGVLQFGVRCT